MSMESETGQEKPSRLSSMLGPGFRFHPTDEELVQYYLRRKVCGKGFQFDAISDVDVYKTEPWDLPHMSKLKTRDLEWYFFSFLDKKYGNGARTNRATEKGYWKTTGKDRTVYHKGQVVGMKKTLVYHSGRPPKGVRSNWVMHEYRRVGVEAETAGIAQDAFVICRIFQKSGSGPRNGEQYGAPLVEEDWDADELELVQSDGTEEVDFGDDTCLNNRDVQQIVGSDVPSDTVPLPVTFQYADGSHVEETTSSFSGSEKPLVCAGDQYCETNMCDDKNIYNMAAASYDMDANGVPIMLENIGECGSGSSDNLGNLDFLLDDSFLDSLDKLPNVDEGFIEANDLSNPSESDTAAFDMLEEYLTFFDANDDSSLYYASDPAMMFGSDDFFSGQTLHPQKEMGEASVLPSGQLIDNHINDYVSSPDNPDLAIYQSDCQYPFIKRASKMLGNISAPPAFAAEFPSKDAVLRLNSVLQSPTPVHVSASTIHVRSGANQSIGKHGNYNVVLSFGFSRGDDGSSSLESSVSIVPGKTVSSMSRGWLYFIFFWVLILSVAFRFSTYIRAN